MSVFARNLLRLAVVAAMIPLANVRAQSGDVDPVKVLKVKAAFLLNFGKFVEWPASAFDGPDAPLVIGVLGPDPFGRILDETVAGKNIQGRRVRIVRLQPSEVERIVRCHIIFVSANSGINPADIATFCVPFPILVVGDRPGFAAAGGMIGFVMEQGRIRFEVCREALARAGLRAAAGFLKLAKLVQSRACGEGD